MTCYSTSQWAQIVEGDITPQLKREAQAHLDACVHCRHKVELLQKTWAWLAEQSAPMPSLAFETQVLKRLHAEAAQRPAQPQRLLSLTWLRKALPVAAAACVLLAMSIVLWENAKQNDAQQDPHRENRLAAPREIYEMTDDLAVLGAYSSIALEEDLPLDLQKYDISRHILEIDEAQDALELLEQMKLLRELSN